MFGGGQTEYMGNGMGKAMVRRLASCLLCGHIFVIPRCLENECSSCIAKNVKKCAGRKFQRVSLPSRESANSGKAPTTRSQAGHPASRKDECPEL
jgi:hypothetical protein